jgi:hypothetical protein
MAFFYGFPQRLTTQTAAKIYLFRTYCSFINIKIILIISYLIIKYRILQNIMRLKQKIILNIFPLNIFKKR